MMFRVRYSLVFGLVVLLQLQVGCLCGKRSEKDHALTLQTKVENLIEKILGVIQDYYQQIRTELKCIPDEIPDTIMGTLKSAIDCVDHNEREYDSGRIPSNTHKKSFLKCFSDAKTKVEETISSIDPNIDYCPQNMTEKTYQINITTTFTKTFHINIKNGLEIMKKKVNMGNGEHICVFNPGEDTPDKENQTGTDNESDEHDGKGPSKEHHGKGPSREHHNKDPASTKEHKGVGHESKEHTGIYPGSAENTSYKEVTQTEENDESDGDVDDSYEKDDADNDEDRNLLLGKPNIINSSNDHAEPGKKVNPKNTFSNLEPILEDDDGDDFGNDYSGVDEEKFFFPDTTAKTKFTTEMENDLEAAKPPSEKISDQDYYADTDTEPEDYNYNSEYYYSQDKEKNYTESSGETLGRIEQRSDQGNPTAGAKQRVQIKPRNRIKQKPKKQQQQQQQFNGRRNIKFPQTMQKKLQSKQPPENSAPSSLAQSFPQSDF